MILSNDVKSRLIDDYTTLEEPSIRSEKGFQYKVIIEPRTTDNVLCSVLYHLPNSDARIKGLNRGDFFNAVDGTQLTLANFESLLVNNSSNQLTLTMVNFDGTTVTPNGNFITVDNEILSSPPILKEELIPQNGDNIGYILYNNDFSKTYLNDLNNVIMYYNSILYNTTNEYIKSPLLNLGQEEDLSNTRAKNVNIQLDEDNLEVEYKLTGEMNKKSSFVMLVIVSFFTVLNPNSFSFFICSLGFISGLITS